MADTDSLDAEDLAQIERDCDGGYGIAARDVRRLIAELRGLRSQLADAGRVAAQWESVAMHWQGEHAKTASQLAESQREVERLRGRIAQICGSWVL